jgi:hypothetical protein
MSEIVKITECPGMLTRLKAARRLLVFGIAKNEQQHKRNAGVLRFAQNDTR